jgi:uncharacterized membrane protein
MSIELPETVKYWSQFFHPVLMWVLLGASLYALYSGIQVWRVRHADKETRKELVEKKFNIRHFQVGGALLAFMVLGAIGAMAITYINNGKLFFGPHLLVGLGMTGLIAVSASLSPFMYNKPQNKVARYTHVFLNVILLGLFGWQAVSGMQIVQKILSNL